MKKTGTLYLRHPGLCTVLVDQGRPSSRSLGVPIGGAADQFSLALGNALVDNDVFTPALEIALQGPRLLADIDLTCVVFGAVVDVLLEGRQLSAGRPFHLPADHELVLGSIREGARAYFCAQGGLWGREVLDSQSSLSPLQKGETLTCSSGDPITRFLPEQPFEWASQPHVLRCLPGLQSSWFPEDALVDKSFTVSATSNRMGIRLEGETLDVPPRSLVSEPVCPGSVQVLGNGQLVILGVDGQTIGGYPKIAQIAGVDVDKLGQIRPGEVIRFERISLSQARTLYQQKQKELEQWLVRLRVTADL